MHTACKSPKGYVRPSAHDFGKKKHVMIKHHRGVARKTIGKKLPQINYRPRNHHQQHGTMAPTQNIHLRIQMDQKKNNYKTSQDFTSQRRKGRVRHSLNCVVRSRNLAGEKQNTPRPVRHHKASIETNKFICFAHQSTSNTP